MRPTARQVWAWGPAVMLMALIFLLSSWSNIPAPPGGLSDVGAHGLVFGLLGMLMVRALAQARWSGVSLRTVVTAVVLTILYGISDEFHQSFVGGRVAEFRDVVADGVGATVGAGVVWAWSIVFSKRDRLPDDL